MNNKSSWRITEVMPTLDVTDLHKAVDWYEKLGFVTDWFYPSKEDATHAGIQAGEINLMLAFCNDPPERIQKQNLYFFLEDMDAFRDELSAHFDDDPPALVESDYGMRDFSLKDPWGHLLTFGEEYL